MTDDEVGIGNGRAEISRGVAQRRHQYVPEQELGPGSRIHDPRDGRRIVGVDVRPDRVLRDANLVIVVVRV